MPNKRLPTSVRLEFRSGALVHSNLSGAASTPGWLWVSGDEACGVDRLRQLTPVGGETLRYGEVSDFPLAGLLDLPGAADEEADLEGMAIEGNMMWVVGSHGLKRKAPKDGRVDKDNARRLASTSLDANRRLLACIPLQDNKNGEPVLVRKATDGRRALRLKGNARENELTKALKDDPHFSPFMGIPGKDNGFDIEGLAVDGNRLLLGLRGPVLRGCSAILEIEVQAQGDNLRLVPLDDCGTLVRKHFLQLEGLGVRDLHFSGEDLLILAGPTMVLNGDVRLFTWPKAKAALAANTEPVRFETGLQSSVALPHGRGTNRAEAICKVEEADASGQSRWIVLYDAPGPDRKEGEFTVFGDLLHGR